MAEGITLGRRHCLSECNSQWPGWEGSGCMAPCPWRTRCTTLTCHCKLCCCHSCSACVGQLYVRMYWHHYLCVLPLSVSCRGQWSAACLHLQCLVLSVCLCTLLLVFPCLQGGPIKCKENGKCHCRCRCVLSGGRQRVSSALHTTGWL